MTKDEFQDRHGAEWATFTKSPAFFAALQLGSSDKLRKMAAITDAEIEANGKTILADYRGHLQLENFLIELAVATAEPLLDLPPETYGVGVDQPAVEEEQPATQTIYFQPASPQPAAKSTRKKKSK